LCFIEVKLTVHWLRPSWKGLIGPANGEQSPNDGSPRLDKVVRLDGFSEGYHASAIGSDLMVEVTKKLQAAGKADSTINRSLSALRRMFNLANRHGKIPHVHHFPMLQEPSARKRVLDHGEYEAQLVVLPDHV